MTRICDLLGINYPILQGGMLWIASAELAAAVSNAGALGVVSPLAGMERGGDPVENLKAQILRTRELTDRPFGVNVPLDLRYAGLLIDLLIQESVTIVVTAAGNPREYTEVLGATGARVLHVVSSVRQARTAEASGVDAVIAEGVDAGAHNGFDEIPLFALIPQVADAVSVPVIAAGGISDARGLAAAMALGAEGVQLGTRFVAAEECMAHQAYKQAIIEAQDSDTVITCRKLVPTRSIKTTFTRILMELDQSGASAEDIHDFWGTVAPEPARLKATWKTAKPIAAPRPA